MKICSTCRLEKEVSNFSRRAATKKDGLSPVCKQCALLVSLAHQKTEKGKATKAAHRKRETAKYAEWNAKYYRKDIEKSRAYFRVKTKEWRQLNPQHRAVKNAFDARRKATKRKATPLWADKEIILAAYEIAALRTKVTGIEWQVDHIVPLISKRVCGLHTDANLRVITKSANSSKGNRHWPDMPQLVKDF